MSYLISVPELVEAAGQELAGLRSALGEATASAAAPTTGIAAAGADEISAAVSQLFGLHGQEFQALSAQAAAFHQEFVGLLNASSAQYAGAEAGAQALLGGSAAAAGGPLQGFESFVNAVAGPYQTLFQTTGLNVQAIQNTFSAQPFPFVSQIINNQIGYVQTAATGLSNVIANLPAEIANLPVAIQNAVNNILTFNPAPYVQGFINTTVANAQTVATGLQGAGNDLATGFQELPPYLTTAVQDLVAGNFPGAWGNFAAGVGNIVLPGFQDISLVSLGETYPIVVLGALGDLQPILALPGQMAQGFTNLLPAGSIVAQIAQNVTNTVSAVTDTGSSLFVGPVLNNSISFGLPLQVIFDAIGVPVNTGSALWSSAGAITSALQAGDYPGALAAVLDAPAVVANGFLNGQTYVGLPPLTIDAGGQPFLTETAYLPVGGLLTPLSPVVTEGLLAGPLGGTEIGGIIPGMLSWGQQLAAAITPLG